MCSDKNTADTVFYHIDMQARDTQLEQDLNIPAVIAGQRRLSVADALRLYHEASLHALGRWSSAMADRIIVSNETFTAEQMYDLGIVHHLAEPGEGVNAVRDFIKKSERRHAGLVGSRRAIKEVWQLELAELNRITEMWADTALKLREQDLKVMSRLVAAQGRVAERTATSDTVAAA